MKILYLSGSTFPSGVTHTLSKVRMCQAFANAGHDVVLAAATGNADADVIDYYGVVGGFELCLRRIPACLDTGVLRFAKLREWLLANHFRKVTNWYKPDVVYSRLTVFELLLLPKAVPVIYEMHSLGALGTGGFKGQVFRWLLKHKRVERIVVTTDALAKQLRDQLPGQDIVIARLSADAPVDIHQDTLKAFRADNLQGLSYRWHVGYTGNLDTVGIRGTEIICQVAAKLPDVAFHIVGGQGEALAFWQHYAEQYNTNGNLFFYGHRNPAQMPHFLSCFDIVLAPLQFRPTSAAPTGAGMSPLKIPQYMSYQKTIVASDIPAHRELLVDGKHARLVGADNVAEWVTAITELLHAPETRSALGKAAYERFLQEFTADSRIRTVLRGY